MVDIVLFTTPFDTSQTEQFSTEPGISIARFLFASGLQDRMQSEPIVVRLNGDEITSAQYDYVICEDDTITLHALPQDGGSILYLIVALAVSYYTYQKLGDLGNENLDDTSPTYNLNSRGNVARLGSPKPVFYGTMRTYPDLGAIPYTEFDASGDQILYQLFEVRQGQCDINTADMRFEDTPLTSFEGYEVEVIAPGDRSTIFPGLVVVSSELDSVEIGPTPNDFGDYKDIHTGVDSPPDAAYYACDIGQEITRVSMDVVADAGIYRVNPEGKLRYRAVTFRFEARKVNDSNVPIGGWFTLANASLESDAENFRAAVRRTFTYAIAKGRYEIRTVRTTTKSDNSNVNDVIKWVGLRGFVAESLPVTTTTRIALKIRASEQLSRRGAAKFNVISEGKIPTWNSGTGWGAPVVTANPAWVFADILHNSVYGAGRGDAFIDLPGLAALATQLQTEGIEFHGGFDTQTTVWDALTKVAAVAQAKPVDRAGVYYMVRDVEAAAPAYMFSHANIVKDSFRLDYSGVLEETADAYRLLFLDKDQDYRETDLLCALPGSAEEKIKDLKIFGAVDKDQVFNWGMYLAAADFYRRRRVEFQTGIEGYLPFYYDTVSVSHYLIGREGQEQVSGDVIAFDGVDRLTLSENVDHLTTPYIVLRNLDGSPTDAYLVSVISNNVVQIAETFDASGLVFESGFERPHFMCGEGEHFFARVKIDSIKANGNGRYTLAGFIDAPEVYDAAAGLPTPPVTTLPQVINIAPVIRNFTATLSGSVDTPIVILRWESDNADYFILQMSYDDGLTWATIAPRHLENFLNHAALIGDIKYRVCGMNVLQGQFYEVEINTGSASYPAATGVTGLMLVSAFVSDFVSVMWSSTELNHKIAFYVGAVEKFVDYVSDINQYTLHAATAKENGLGRSFTVKVWSISQYGQLSASSVDLAVSNPAPAALTGISVVPSQVSIEVNWNANADSDLAGYVAYMSATSGFTPSLSNRVYKGLSNKVTLTSLGGVKLNAGQTYYVRVAAFDIYGEDVLNYSSEFSATILSFASGIQPGEITATMIANGALDMTKFASGIRPPRVVTSLPTIDGSTYKNQDTVLLTSDGKLYRAVSGAWTKETDGADLKANSILAGSISAGAVGVTQLAANAVTAEKMFIGPQGSALNFDPALSDASAWAGGLAFTTISDGAVGSTCARGQGTFYEVKRIPVDPTKTYRIRAWVRKSAGANGTLYLGVALNDSSGANIGGPTGSYWYAAAANSGVNTYFQEYVGYIGPSQPVYVTPSNARQMTPLALMNYGGTTGYAEIQDFRIEEVLPGTLIKDGAINTDKLSANAVTADKVNTNSLTSDSGFINNLFANTFTARKITATEINSNGLSIRDGSGNVIFSAGVPLTATYADNALKNSSITVDGSGNINGIGSGSGINVANNIDGIIRQPGGGIFTTTTNTYNGALKIRLPQFFTNTMIKFSVSIYEYDAGYSCNLEIAGYNYLASQTWYNTTAKVIGGNVEYPVYFGHDGTYCCIWIGTNSETWSFPQVHVRDVLLGYSGGARALWESGWVISFDTAAISAGTGANQYSNSVLDTLPGADWSKTARRPANIASLTGSEGILNGAISLNANGTINGAGGGAVTIGGLGYTGALNATKNTVTRSASAPSSPTDGDVWVDTSGTLEVTKVRVSGAWQTGATNGATIGTNLSGQITSGNVSTFIASAAIGAAQIGSLNASVINAGSMSAAYITAGSITTDKIQVGAVTANSHFSSSTSSTVGATSTKAIELSLGSFTSSGVESSINCSCVMELGSDFASSTGLNSSTAFITADVYLKVDGTNKVGNSITGSVVRTGSTYFAHIPFSFVHRDSYSAGSHSVSVRFEAIFWTAAGGTQNQSSTTECTLRANCLVQENKV